MKPNYVILAIETSLDDTCAAVTVGEQVLSNVVASQVAFHAEWGGTVPHIAKRKHVEWIDRVIAAKR
jgi:N6-L-threonylcarbamoyladenine synthase